MMDQIFAYTVFFTIGAVVATVVGWLVVLRPARLEATAARTAATEAERRAAVAEERGTRTERAEAETAELRLQLQTARDAVARLESRLAVEEREAEARLEELRNAETRLAERFRTLATETLDANGRRFLDAVSERFESHKKSADEDLAKRQTEIATLVKPLAENLTRFETRIGEIEKTRQGAYRAIEEQVKALREGNAQLGAETRRLVQALRAPKGRGQWGELQLRQVFEMAGMVEHVDFLLEHSIEDDEGGRLRPDAVVRMPGGKSIVVDAKTPLDAYLTMIEATEADAQRDALAAHARQLRTQMQNLSRKEYWARLEGSPDFVVMFVPGEAIYSAAIQTDPALFEDAFRNRVLIATPTTLIALVKAIAYGWQQERLAENAREVRDNAIELYDRLSTLGDHLSKLGRSLRQTVENYNRSVGSLESRVLPAARRFEQLGVAPHDASLANPGQVETEPRSLTAPELVDGSDGPDAPR